MQTLDEEYHKDRPLRIVGMHREQLSVNKLLWEKTVHGYERRFNFGCTVWFVLFFFLIPFVMILTWWFFLAMIFIGISTKIINTRRCENLMWHAHFDYEFAEDRLVRYEDTTYSIFYIEDLHSIQVKSFGILIRTEPNWLDRFHMSALSCKDKTLLIIPRDIQSYEQVIAFLEKKRGPNVIP